MKSYDAIRRMVGGHHEEIAKAIHRSANLVYRWTLPALDYTDSGAFNDLDRLELGMREALQLGVKPMDALAPIDYLAHSFGGVVLPPVPHVCGHRDLSRQTTRAMKECAEAIAASAAALEDDRLSPAERKGVLKELYEARHHLLALTRMYEEAEG
jgi:hypothetical protein